jgi:hypothetical protein
MASITGIPTFIFDLLNKSTKESLFKLTGKALDDAIKAINKSVKGANRKKDVDKTKLNKEANDIIGSNKTSKSAPANQNAKSSSSKPANQNVASSSSSAPKPANQNVLGPSKVSGGGKSPKTPAKTPNYNKRGAVALATTAAVATPFILSDGSFNFKKVLNFLTGGEDKEPNKNVIDKFFKGKPRIAKKKFIDELDRLNKKSGRSGDSRTNAKKVSKKVSTDKDRPPSDAPPLPKEKPTPPKEIDDKKIDRQNIREAEVKTSKKAKRDKILKGEGERQQGQIPKKKAKKEGRFSQGKKTIKTPFGNLVADSTDEGMSKFMGTKDEIRQQMEDEEMNFRKGGMARAKAFGKGGTYKSPKKNYTNGINMRYGGATKRSKGY